MAARAVGNRRRVYAGSFDLLLRVRNTRSPTWKAFHGKEVPFDMKLSGAASTVGIDSKTIKNILAHGQAVLAASQSSGGRLGERGLAAYLFHRPPGLTMGERMHGGSWEFLLFDMAVFMWWSPHSKHAPRRLMEPGTFIKDGARDELNVAPAAPLGPTLVVSPRPRRDTWADLAGVSVRRG